MEDIVVYNSAVAAIRHAALAVHVVALLTRLAQLFNQPEVAPDIANRARGRRRRFWLGHVLRRARHVRPEQAEDLNRKLIFQILYRVCSVSGNPRQCILNPHNVFHSHHSYSMSLASLRLWARRNVLVDSRFLMRKSSVDIETSKCVAFVAFGDSFDSTVYSTMFLFDSLNLDPIQWADFYRRHFAPVLHIQVENVLSANSIHFLFILL